MNNPLFETINECAKKSWAGTISFGEVVGELARAGVESYHADYRDSSTTYYMPDGSTYSLKLDCPAIGIPEHFDKEGIQSAIRGAQRGEVKYPEFLRLSTNAGCAGYMVWIAGRHVTYFGRHGEQHIEPFPD